MEGDADIAAVAGLLADRARTRILLALADGRALASTTLAAEAGVAASTASAHLSKLLDAQLLAVEAHGRHRYYRLAGPDVARLIEGIARVAPAAPIRSLREGTRAQAIRSARVCYDHLAGRLGTDLMAAMLSDELITGGDGQFHPGGGTDRLSAPGTDVSYELTSRGGEQLDRFGVDVTPARHRRMVRYCVDWSEQRHHLAGTLGARLLSRMLELRWLRRDPHCRATRLTDAGRTGLADTFGVETPA
jgi:DNA-binding transcriptional ArsR family regulator